MSVMVQVTGMVIETTTVAFTITMSAMAEGRGDIRHEALSFVTLNNH